MQILMNEFSKGIFVGDIYVSTTARTPDTESDSVQQPKIKSMTQ